MIDTAATCCFAAAHLLTGGIGTADVRHISHLHQFAVASLSHSLPPWLGQQTIVAPAPQLAIRRGSNAAAIAYRRPVLMAEDAAAHRNDAALSLHEINRSLSRHGRRYWD
jgi:hypothetical protein